MYYVYVIRSMVDQKRYIGITNNLKRRITQHNKGNTATQSTMNRGPFNLVYYEVMENRVQARKREKYLKTGGGRRFLKKMEECATRP